MRKHKALPLQPIEGITGLFDEAPNLLLQLERFLRFKKSLAGFCERVIGYGNQEFVFFNNQRVRFSDARERFEVLCSINQQQEKTIERIYSLTNYLLGSLPYDSRNSKIPSGALAILQQFSSLNLVKGNLHIGRAPQYKKLMRRSVRVDQFINEIKSLDALALLRLEDIAASDLGYGHIKKLGELLLEEERLWEGVFKALSGSRRVEGLIAHLSKISFKKAAFTERFLSYLKEPFPRAVAFVLISLEICFGVTGFVKQSTAEQVMTVKSKAPKILTTKEDIQKNKDQMEIKKMPSAEKNNLLETLKKEGFSPKEIKKNFLYLKRFMELAQEDMKGWKAGEAKAYWDSCTKSGIPIPVIPGIIPNFREVSPMEAQVYVAAAMKHPKLLQSFRYNDFPPEALAVWFPQKYVREKVQWKKGPSPEDFSKLMSILELSLDWLGENRGYPSIDECRLYLYLLKQSYPIDHLHKATLMLSKEPLPFKEKTFYINEVARIFKQIKGEEIEEYLQAMKKDRKTQLYKKIVFIESYHNLKILPREILHEMDANPGLYQIGEDYHIALIYSKRKNLAFDQVYGIRHHFGLKTAREKLERRGGFEWGSLEAYAWGVQAMEYSDDLEQGIDWLKNNFPYPSDFGIFLKTTIELKKKCGITHFYRFDPAQFLKILRYSNTEKPEALIVLPRTDWNGAFSIEEARKIYSEIIENYDAMIIEAENEDEMYEAMEHTYKESGQISLLVIVGHGSRFTTSFGDVDPRLRNPEKGEKYYLGVEDIDDIVKKNLRSFLAGDCIIWSDSCSTAADGTVQDTRGNLAEIIHRAFERTVFASKTDFCASDVTLEFKDNKIVKITIKSEENTVVLVAKL
ncbi:hypothetical protein HYU13_01570 [Candidatus Woesearchaeota archaeon]|nr:hypothetical protein [Candidatus Woesearchaeota archaeon]